MKLTLKQAKEIAMEWHGGFGTALYQFGSSGKVLPGNISRYIAEINDNIPLASPLWKGRLKKLKAFLKERA